MSQSLLYWMRENLSDKDHNPLWGKDYIYRKAGIDQMMFFRDKIATLFYRPYTDKEVYTDEHRKYRDEFCQIVGWHRSKSLDLPVYGIEIPGLKIVARDNFHDWNVTVISDKEIALPEYFKIDGANSYLFYQGMENYKKGMYKENQKEFSFCVSSNETLFAIMWCISSQKSQS